MMSRHPLLMIPTAAVFLLLSACASTSTGSGASTDRVVTGLGTRTGNLDFYQGPNDEAFELPVGIDQAWPLLVATYEALELGPGKIDTAARIVGHPELTVSRRVVGQRLGRVFRCGETMTGSVASQSRITINVETKLEGAPDGTALAKTTVVAFAIPNDGSGTVRDCTSTGRLEQEIHERLLAEIVTGNQ